MCKVDMIAIHSWKAIGLSILMSYSNPTLTPRTLDPELKNYPKNSLLKICKNQNVQKKPVLRPNLHFVILLEMDGREKLQQ